MLILCVHALLLAWAVFKMTVWFGGEKPSLTWKIAHENCTASVVPELCMVPRRNIRGFRREPERERERERERENKEEREGKRARERKRK